MKVHSARQVMTRLVAILVTLFLVAIPAKADVALWSRPVPGWTVIEVYGHIQQADFATFQSLTENADPATTLVIVTGPGGNLAAGIGMGIRVRLKWASARRHVPCYGQVEKRGVNSFTGTDREC
jgi:hypothetical protein